MKAVDITDEETKRLAMFFHLLWEIDQRVNKEKRDAIQQLVNILDLYVIQQLKESGILSLMIYNHDTEHTQSTRHA